MEFELATFLPAEAERITSVSAVMQRSYRHRGFLPSHDGRDARHNVLDLARMTVIAGLLARDFPAGGKARGLVELIATEAARRALEQEAAWAPHPDLAGVPMPELAAAVLLQHSPGGSAERKGRFFVLFGEADHMGFYHTLDAALADGEALGRYAGPGVFFDTLAMGAHILARAGRPLVSAAEPVPFEMFSAPSRMAVI